MLLCHGTFRISNYYYAQVPDPLSTQNSRNVIIGKLIKIKTARVGIAHFGVVRCPTGRKFAVFLGMAANARYPRKTTKGSNTLGLIIKFMTQDNTTNNHTVEKADAPQELGRKRTNLCPQAIRQIRIGEVQKSGTRLCFIT